MTVSALLGRCALGVAAVFAGLGFAGAAQAVPIYTYTFTQTGYVSVNPANLQQGSVTGSFSGTLDSGGHITRSTLTAFHLEIAGFGLIDPYWSQNTPPLLFSYRPGVAGSLEVIDPGFYDGFYQSNICIGVLPAGIACGGGSAVGTMTLSLAPITTNLALPVFLQFATNSAPVLTGSVSDVGDPVYLVATTPIPASLLLFGTAFGGLSLLAIIRRRRHDPVALAA